MAAPVTTIDVDTPDGGAIHIEQRDAAELTHFRGHRVAAEGIGVCACRRAQGQLSRGSGPPSPGAGVRGCACR